MDDILCGTIKYEMGINPYVISCDARAVKEITVVGGSQDGVLTLCEVEVFEGSPPGMFEGVNFITTIEYLVRRI